MNDPNADNEPRDPDSNATPVPQSNEGIDVHNLYNNAARDDSLTNSSSTRGSSDSTNNTDPDKSGFKVSTATFTECALFVGATLYAMPSSLSGLTGGAGETDLTGKLPKSSEGSHLLSQMSQNRHQKLQKNELGFEEIQTENKLLKSQCESMNKELYENNEEIVKRERKEKKLKAELVDLKESVIEMQKMNLKANEVKHENESKMLAMLNDKEEQLKELLKKVDQLQKKNKEQEAVIEKQRVSIQRNALQIREYTLKEVGRITKDKERARENATQMKRIEELEQNTEELNKQIVAIKKIADERLTENKTANERADRIQLEYESQKQELAAAKDEMQRLSSAQVSKSIIRSSNASQRQPRVVSYSEHTGQYEGEI